MIDAKQPDAAKKYHIEDGALAEGEGAVAVSKDGIYVHGNVVGDVLGAGAIKVTITEETTSRCMDCQTCTWNCAPSPMKIALPSPGEALCHGLHRYQEGARHILRVQAAEGVQRERHLF